MVMIMIGMVLFFYNRSILWQLKCKVHIFLRAGRSFSIHDGSISNGLQFRSHHLDCIFMIVIFKVIVVMSPIVDISWFVFCSHIRCWVSWIKERLFPVEKLISIWRILSIESNGNPLPFGSCVLLCCHDSN